MNRWSIAVAILVALLCGVAIGKEITGTPAGTGARVVRDLVARDALHVDVHTAGAKTPWVVFAHERGWPAPDERERVGEAIADALGRRGIAVVVVSFGVTEAAPLSRAASDVAAALREVSRRSAELGLAGGPVLAGDALGATLVAMLALDPALGGVPGVRGVVTTNGTFDDGDDAPLRHVRADAPPFLVLSAHGEPPRAAQSSRAFVRALERAGAKGVHGHHLSMRDERSLTNLSGERNDVGELVAAFVKGEPMKDAQDSAFAIDDAWDARAPLSSEPFRRDARLVTKKPVDEPLRAQMRRVLADYRDLDPWPGASYDAIDLASWLEAHPDAGSGPFVITTNARGEQLVLTREEIARKKPEIVIGLDDETNLFRMFVTYNVYRSYSWKPEAEQRPLLVRNVGAFLHVPGEASGSFPVTTGADFALTTASFRVASQDPLAAARGVPKEVGVALTNEQGCLQCHALRGVGPRSHHLRARDGVDVGGLALPLEEYPREVLRRFLFEQDDIAKTFGVSPIRVAEPAASLLFAEATRAR